MSEQNVQIVRGCDEAFNRGDVEAVLVVTDPDVEFIPRRAPIQGVYHGHQGIREFFADNAENFDLFEVHTEETQDLGDRVLAFGTVRIRGTESGVEVSVPLAAVVTFRDGKIVRLEDFGERSRALEAAGLAE